MGCREGRAAPMKPCCGRQKSQVTTSHNNLRRVARKLSGRPDDARLRLALTAARSEYDRAREAQDDHLRGCLDGAPD